MQPVSMIGAQGALRVLALGAHCDDIEIGCGGTLLRLLAERERVEVHWVVFCSTAERAAEGRASASAFLDGAWLPLGLGAVVPLLWMFVKVMVFMLAYVWFRGTFPRYRFDQLMALGWKWMLPLALVNVVITGIMKLAV